VTHVGGVARFEFESGNEEAVEAFFRDGRAIVEGQPDTTVWFSYRVGPTTYGAFAAFASDDDRQALLSVGGPQLSRDNAALFAGLPSFELVDIIESRQTAVPLDSTSRTDQSAAGSEK
jgi:hypothetical protein